MRGIGAENVESAREAAREAAPIGAFNPNSVSRSSVMTGSSEFP